MSLKLSEIGLPTGKFELNQSINGAVYIIIGTNYTHLALDQIKDLGIKTSDIPDFDNNKYKKYYEKNIH